MSLFLNHLAMRAMQSILTTEAANQVPPEAIAKRAVSIAQAMRAELRRVEADENPPEIDSAVFPHD